MLKKWMCLLAALMLLVSAAAALADEPSVGTGTMFVHTDNGKSLSVRSEPSSGGTVIGRVDYGGEVVVKEFLDDGWCAIEWTNGATGYVQSRYLQWYRPDDAQTEEEKELEERKKAELASEKEVEPYMIQARASRSSGWVVLRKDPVRGGETVEKIEDSAELMVIAETDHWYKATNPETGATGYLYKDYALVIPPAETEVKVTKLHINGGFVLQGAIPAGYKLQVLTSQKTRTKARIVSMNKKKPTMRLTISFDEMYADVDRMNDLSEAEMDAIKATFGDDDVEFSETETAYGTKLLVVREAGDAPDFVDFVSVYKGYYIEFLLVPSEEAEEQKLSDEEIQMCIDFLSNLDFIPVEEDEQAGA